MANHYVRDGAAGAADGSNWTDAWDDLPAALTRGDTYYIASGTYTNYVFDDAASGALYIYIKKATVAAHGTNTGWSDAYATGQALFASANAFATWWIQAPYYDFDGVTGSGASGHGIQVYDSLITSWACVLSTDVSHLNFSHLEVKGGSPGGVGTPNEQRLMRWYAAGAPTGINIRYCYIHEGGQEWIFLGLDGMTDVLIEYCYFDVCSSGDPAFHAAGIALSQANTSSMNLTIRYNVFRDVYGSAYIELMGGGIYIYGNIFYKVAAWEGTSGGVLIFASTDYGDDITFHNNTIYGLHNTAGATWGLCSNTDCTNWFARNNLFQSCDVVPTFATDHGLVESNNEKNTGLATLSNPAFGNFHLTAETNAGLALAAPYTTDPDGVTRGAGAVWDLGAYEFTSGAWVMIYG